MQAPDEAAIAWLSYNRSYGKIPIVACLDSLPAKKLCLLALVDDTLPLTPYYGVRFLL